MDGDSVKPKNLSRQFYPEAVGWSKAKALAKLALKTFQGTRIKVVSVPEYFNENTLAIHRTTWMKENMVVFGCVDNNATRCLLEDTLDDFRNVVLIDGGNDDTEGQAQMWVKRKRENVLPKISEISPEMRAHDGKMPGIHCMNEGGAQTAAVNKAVSVAMEMLFREFMEEQTPYLNQITVDVDKCLFRAYRRHPVPVA